MFYSHNFLVFLLYCFIVFIVIEFKIKTNSPMEAKKHILSLTPICIVAKKVATGSINKAMTAFIRYP